MTSVGETLRRERLRRNLELDQISRELRISTKFLEAIEAEHFDRLPGTVFAKSFVRQYARMLELNEEDLAAQVGRSSEPTAFSEQHTEANKPVLEGIHVPRMDEWQSVGDRQFRWSPPLTALGGVVLVMLACSAIYTWWQRSSTAVAGAHTNPPIAAPAPATDAPLAVPTTVEPPASQATPAPPPADAAAVQRPPVVAPPTAAPPAAVASATPPAAAVPGAPAAVRVGLTAVEPVWVLARANGKYLFSGTLEANQTRTVEAAGTLLLRFGNAGGVNVDFNGKNLGALGPKGQVRTIQFTSGGFQIVAAPSPSPLEEDR